MTYLTAGSSPFVAPGLRRSSNYIHRSGVSTSKNFRHVWANQAGLKLWKASTREELIAKDCCKDMSEVARQWIEAAQRCTMSGHTHHTQKTFYPNDEPVVVSPTTYRLEEWPEREIMFCAGQVLTQPDCDLVMHHSVEAFRYTPAPLVFLDFDGNIQTVNAAFTKILGAVSAVAQLFSSADEWKEVVGTISTSHVVESDVRLRTTAGTHWFNVTLGQTVNPGDGSLALTIAAFDITCAAGHERFGG